MRFLLPASLAAVPLALTLVAAQRGNPDQTASILSYIDAHNGEALSLVPYAVVYRFFFISLVDVAKLFATFEQLLNTRMTWGKLERVGRI